MYSYTDIVEVVQNQGSIVAPRGIETFELIGPSITFPAGTQIHRTKMSSLLGFTEAMMLVGGMFDIDLIAQVAPNAKLELYRKQSDYGNRVGTQIQKCFETLIHDPYSRRAVALLNDRELSCTDDLACTTSIQFLIRNEQLETIVSMRSWDLVYGFPLDIIMFGMLTQVMARTLNVIPGHVKVYAGSLHVYNNNTLKLATEASSPSAFWIDDSWHFCNNILGAQKYARDQVLGECGFANRGPLTWPHRPHTVYSEKMSTSQPFQFKF